MPPKQKAVKMDLTTFLNDDTLGGGWADDDVDFNTIEIPSKKGGAFGATGLSSGGAANLMDPAFGGHDGPKREFTEYPVPDAPPYRARFNNLPWDVTEDSIGEYAESCADEAGSVERVSAPRDMNDPTRLRGFAFVTYVTKSQLENALKCSGQEMSGRRVYIAVAAPDKAGFGSRMGRDEPNLDWGSARGSGFSASRGDDGFGSSRGGEDRPRREEPNLDWGSARGSGSLPDRPRREFREPREDREDRPKREEPNLDWGAARGSGALPDRPRREFREPREEREDRPKREEPNLDWGSARGSGALPDRPRREFREPREPKEDRPKKEEPNLDWGAARGSGSLPPRQPRQPREPRTNSNPKKTSAIDTLDSWSRGSQLPARNTAAATTTSTAKRTVSLKKEEAPKPAGQKSAFAVLAADDDDEDEEEDLVEKTEKLSV